MKELIQVVICTVVLAAASASSLALYRANQSVTLGEESYQQLSQLPRVVARVDSSFSDNQGNPWTGRLTAYLRIGDEQFSQTFTPDASGRKFVEFNLSAWATDGPAGLASQVSGTVSIFPAGLHSTPDVQHRFYFDPLLGTAAFDGLQLSLQSPQNQGEPFYFARKSFTLAPPPHYGDVLLSGIGATAVAVHVDDFRGEHDFNISQAANAGHSYEVAADGVYPIYRWSRANGALVAVTNQDGTVAGHAILRRAGGASISIASSFTVSITGPVTAVDSVRFVAFIDASVPVTPIAANFPESQVSFERIRAAASRFQPYKGGTIPVEVAITSGSYRVEVIDVTVDSVGEVVISRAWSTVANVSQDLSISIP